MNLSDLENNIARDDEITKVAIGEPRKPKLTFKHLHKLRKIRELKNLEQINTSRQLEMIYGQSSESPELPSF